MKLVTVSHSHIALRQQLFFKEVARQGHDVLMISPGEWGNLRTKNQRKDTWKLKTCRHMMGENIYHYHLLGAKDLAEEFKPDWLYVQAEAGSLLAAKAPDWKVSRRALFVWENIELKGELQELPKYDLVICGNPEAEALIKSHNPNTALMLQVGVDTDHFRARPNVSRDIQVAYVGRPSPEKGLPYLSRAWPTVKILDWKDFLELPWWYSQIQVVVAYSQDIPKWREQAPNYVVLEALSCGARAVISDTTAMKYWLEGCPGVVIVEGHDQPDDTIRYERPDRLKEGIEYALAMELLEDEGRRWVIDKFSNQVVAKKLLEVLK